MRRIFQTNPLSRILNIGTGTNPGVSQDDGFDDESAGRRKSMREKVMDVMERFQMLRKGDKLLVAVSGGQDSVSLLHFLNEIRNEFKLDLGIVHVNHLLRQNESDGDDFFVKQLSERYRIPLYSEKIDVGEYARMKRLSIEEAARHCRYHCFSKVAKAQNVQKVALAHTRDDNSETVLMRIIRGTGLKGLRAIQPVLRYHETTFIRPLLECTGLDIRNYLKMHRLKYRIDMSNRYIKFFRNKIRHELIPVLEQEYNPRIQESLTRMVATVNADYDFLNSLTTEAYQKVVRQEKEGLIVLDKDAFQKYHDAIKYRVLEVALTKIIPEAHLPYLHWSRIQAVLRQQANFSIYVHKTAYLEIRRSELVLRAKPKPMPYEYYIFNNEKLLIKECDMSVSLKEVEPQQSEMAQRNLDPFTELLDIDKLEFPLMIRNRQNGDRMAWGSQQHEKKIKDLLNDKRVPFYLRDEVPLLLSKKKVIWCWGVGTSESYRAGAGTKRILQLSISAKSNSNNQEYSESK